MADSVPAHKSTHNLAGGAPAKFGVGAGLSRIARARGADSSRPGSSPREMLRTQAPRLASPLRLRKFRRCGRFCKPSGGRPEPVERSGEGRPRAFRPAKTSLSGVAERYLLYSWCSPRKRRLSMAYEFILIHIQSDRQHLSTSPIRPRERALDVCLAANRFASRLPTPARRHRFDRPAPLG